MDEKLATMSLIKGGMTFFRLGKLQIFSRGISVPGHLRKYSKSPLGGGHKLLYSPGNIAGLWSVIRVVEVLPHLHIGLTPRL